MVNTTQALATDAVFINNMGGWVHTHAHWTMAGCIWQGMCTALFNPHDAPPHLRDEDTDLPQIPRGLHAGSVTVQSILLLTL